MRLRTLSVVFLLVLSGCVSAGPPRKPNEREWNLLSAEYQRIESARSQIAMPSTDAPRKEQIEALLRLHRESEPATSAFFEKVKEYYLRTADPRAVRIYADEKIRIGDEYMEILARYDRAIGVYQSALAIDPGNERATERLATAQSRRFIAHAPFSEIQPRMKESEVRRKIGLPREDWIKQVVQKNRIFSVWIYPRSDGGAAAIYFENGVVYHTNWNAAQAQPESPSNP